jgi:Cu2+-exporting ATPase
MLEVAARLALSSHHPLAQALSREARQRMPFEGALEEAGQGVRAVINGVETRLGSFSFCGVERPQLEPGVSAIAFAHNGRTAVFRIRQALRPDAARVAHLLANRGFELHILSGDHAAAVAPVAVALGISRALGGLNPAEKICMIEALKAQGRKVLMVGDGLNDAPALAAAHVSLSPISAADITQAHADAVFLGDKLAPVADALAIAKRARRLMSQNLWLAVLYNAVAVPVAVAGLVTPLIAALAMSGSSLLVTLNALRGRSGR